MVVLRLLGYRSGRSIADILVAAKLGHGLRRDQPSVGNDPGTVVGGPLVSTCPIACPSAVHNPITTRYRGMGGVASSPNSLDPTQYKFLNRKNRNGLALLVIFLGAIVSLTLLGPIAINHRLSSPGVRVMTQTTSYRRLMLLHKD